VTDSPAAGLSLESLSDPLSASPDSSSARQALTKLEADGPTQRKLLAGDEVVTTAMKRLWGAAYPATAPAPDPGRAAAPADGPGGYAPPLPVDLLQQPNGTALAEAIQAAAFAEALPKTTYDGLIRTMQAASQGEPLSGRQVMAALARTHGGEREAVAIVKDAAALLSRMTARDGRLTDVAALLASSPEALASLAFHERHRRGGR
jgi:hypothetical protein